MCLSRVLCLALLLCGENFCIHLLYNHEPAAMVAPPIMMAPPTVSAASPIPGIKAVAAIAGANLVEIAEASAGFFFKIWLTYFLLT